MKPVKILLLVALAWCGVNSASAQTWTLQTNLPSSWFISIASSADGTKLVAAGAGLYTSTNSGISWTQATNAPNGPYTSWYGNCVASSADGTKLVAATMGGGICISPDSGVTWSDETNLPNYVASIASSADGTKLVALTLNSGMIFTSTNAGITWMTQTNVTSVFFWGSVASSANGVNLVAASANEANGYPGLIYISTNSGMNWSRTSAPSNQWTSVASSADGNKLVAAPRFTNTVFGYLPVPIWISTNQGTTWTPTSAPTNTWLSVASSADGTKLVAVSFGGGIFTSTDSGATWTTNTTQIADATQPPASAAASSADGNKLVIASSVGGIYTSQAIPAPLLSIAPSDTNFLFSWIVPSTNFGLQQNSDLTTTNWTDVTNPPILNLTNLQYEVTLPLNNGSGFYRLATQ